MIVDPWTGVLLLLTAGPLFGGLVFMLLYSIGLAGLLADGFTLHYWLRVMTDGQTWRSLIYSLFIGGTSLGASLALALALQAALGDRLRGSALSGLLFLPLAVPPLTAAVLSVEIIGNGGLLSRLAHAAGWIGAPADFPTVLFTPSGIGIVITHMTLVTPFLLLLLDRIAANERLRELTRVAQTLGASHWQSWRWVALPILLRSSAPALTVYSLVLAGAFEIPLIVGAQSPAMISVLIQRRFGQYDLRTRPEAYALACLYAGLAIGGLLAFSAWRSRRVPRDGRI